MIRNLAQHLKYWAIVIALGLAAASPSLLTGAF